MNFLKPLKIDILLKILNNGCLEMKYLKETIIKMMHLLILFNLKNIFFLKSCKYKIIKILMVVQLNNGKKDLFKFKIMNKKTLY
jgi:hypothetical protein